MKKAKYYINGKIVPAAEARISVLDRGLLYGDGVFESLRTYNKRPFMLEQHIKRLLRSAKQLRISGLPSAGQLKSAVKKILSTNKFKESYIKIIISRGPAKGHGLSPKKAAGKATLIIIIEQQQVFPRKVLEQGWKVIISSLVRPDLPSSRIKSLNYLDSILAVIEAGKAGADEALMLDEKGNLAEGTISNVFIVKHGILFTPPISAPILAGITRNLVIRLARQSAFRVEEKAITPKELYTADECFITFSGAGVVPVTRIWKKKIGSGKCGYVTAALINLYEAETAKA